jgi:phosphoribosyl 1,2-cyclic phosphodiesterase
MIIRCWGARGSIPVSGKEYLKYGGDTTCIEVRTKDDDIIIIDAGTGIRRLGNALLAEGRHDYTMFFTHAHWDHLIGFPFFKPIYYQSVSINMYGCPFAQSTVKEMLSKVMSAPHFPVDYEEIHCDITYHETCGDQFTIKSMHVTSIPLSHPNQGVGYKFEEDGKTFVFLTDNELSYQHPGGLVFDDYREFCMGADLLIHDAEFMKEDYKKAWGHSTLGDAFRLAVESKVKTLGIFHHNQERSDEGIDAMLAVSKGLVRRDQEPIECVALCQGMEFVL